MEFYDKISLKIENFILHLNKIGLLTEEDNQIFLNNFYELYKTNNINESISLDLEQNQKYIEEILTKTLLVFLNSLNEEKNKIISLNVYKNYILNEKSLCNKKGSLLYQLYKKNKSKLFFKKWFVLSNNILNSKTIFKETLEESNNNTISYNISNILHPKENNKKILNQNNSNNSFYNNYSTKKSPSNNILLNFKYNNNKIINLTRNHDYSLNELNIAERLLNSKSVKNKTECKIIDNKKSYTFTNDYSLYNNDNNIKYSGGGEKVANYDYIKNNLSDKNSYQLFNKKVNTNKKKQKKINDKLKGHFEYLGNLSKSKKEHKLIPEKTTEYIKEQEELKNNCTFKPKINNYKTPKSSLKKIKYNTSEKLYLDNQVRMAKRTTETLLRDNKLSKENTFQPTFVSSSVKKLKKNFSLRLYNFSQLKEAKMNKIINSIETDCNSICTFSPKLNLSYNNKLKKNNNNNINVKKVKIPAYQRLYDNNKEKLIRQEERKNQHIEEILSKANNPLKYKKLNLNINTNNTYNNISSTTKSVDYKKLDELYNDYKKKQIKIRQKKELIDSEDGITFNPILINGEKYLDKIEPNFHRREKNFVENQKNHIEAYRIYLIKEKERHLKTYSEDKKIIIKNVVDRLYKEGLEKMLTKNNTKPKIFSKKNYKTENKETYDGNETVYVNQSILKIESLKELENNNNMKKCNSNESNLIKNSNIKTSMVTNDNLSSSKDNNNTNTNINEQIPLIINSK